MSLVSNKILVRQTFYELIGKAEYKTGITIYSYFISDFNIIEIIKDNCAITRINDTEAIILEECGYMPRKKLANVVMDSYFAFDGRYTYYSIYPLNEEEKENILISFTEIHC